MQVRVCEGCGAALQTDDPALPGYVPGRVLQTSGRAVCRRCHRTRIAPNPIFNRLEENTGGVRRALDQADLSLLVVDVVDFEGTFSKRLMPPRGHKLMVVANKADLLPGRTPHAEVQAWLQNRVDDANIPYRGVFLISASKGTGTKALWDAVKKELGGRGTVAILGVSGVGKSTLINTWLDFGTRQEKKKRVRRKQRKTTSEDPAVVVLTNEIPGGDAGVSSDASIADMPIFIGNNHVDEEISSIDDLSPSQAAETTTANTVSFKDVASDSEPVAATKTSAPLPIDDDEAHENHDNNEIRVVSPKTRRHRRPARSKKRNHPVHTAEHADESVQSSPTNGNPEKKIEIIPNGPPARRPKNEKGKPKKVASKPVVVVADNESKTDASKPDRIRHTRRKPRRRRPSPQVEVQSTASNDFSSTPEVKAEGSLVEAIAVTLPTTLDANQTETTSFEKHHELSERPAQVLAQRGKSVGAGQRVDRADIKVFDTPSLPGRGRALDILCHICAEKLIPQKPLRSKVLRLKAGQAVIIAGLAGIAVKQVAPPSKTAFLLLFTSPTVSLEYVTESALHQFAQGAQHWQLDACNECQTRLWEGGWEEAEMEVDQLHDLALHGLGWLSVRKSTVTLRVMIPAGMLASLRPRLVGPKEGSE